jgi:hypothetical protein
MLSFGQSEKVPHRIPIAGLQAPPMKKGFAVQLCDVGSVERYVTFCFLSGF